MKAFFSAWIAGGLLLFYFGPIDWAGAQTPAVALYVGLSWVMFLWGSASSKRKGTFTPFSWQPRSQKVARVVMGLHAGLAIFYVFVTTGRSALSADAYSLDLGGVYASYGEFSATLQLGPVTQLMILAKAALFPLALLVFVQYFKRDRLVVLLFIGPLLISSLFRGTDKEILDGLILVTTAAYLHGMLTVRRFVAGAALITGALSLFFFRRVGRFGGEVPACLPDSETCFNYDSFVSEQFGRSAEMLSVFLAHYLTNGYQGLSNAFGLSWQPNWGVGHLPSVKHTLCSLGDQACPTGDYQQALTASGWDAESRWTSVYPVLANDLSFWLVPIFMFLVGVAFQRSMSAWRLTGDPAAGASLAIIAVFVIYSSANMQIAISIDWTLATIVFLYIAPWRRMQVAEHVPERV